MGMCPICNGFKKIYPDCPSCGNIMENKGKEMDYYDDYSPYMEVDGLKLIDGYPSTYFNKECPHLFVCSVCGHDKVILIKE